MPCADLERLIAHAHRFRSRIFITLNTILRDDELEDARRMAWQVYEAGADALIVQDMGLLQLDLPPSSCTPAHKPTSARPKKPGFCKTWASRKSSWRASWTWRRSPPSAMRSSPARPSSFSCMGRCAWPTRASASSATRTPGRSANRGDCNQACRLPYEVLDAQGRIIAHEKHVLSMKDNNQSDNLRALIDAGVRSFKIEGRYKDMGYVKNITAHYRKLLDEIVEEARVPPAPPRGRTTFSFTPDPDQNFNREFTDYFVQGRQIDIGAFDTPKTPGRAIGWVTQIGPAGDKWFELEVSDKTTQLHNGDGLCYYDLQKELVGIHVNRAECVHAKKGIWRIFPKMR